MSKLDEIIFQALGEESAFFMSNSLPGTQQIMPTEQLNPLGERTKQQIKDLMLELHREAMSSMDDDEPTFRELVEAL